MTFYQELQLNQGGSKELIRSSQDKKEKLKHIVIFNFKVYLIVAFCVVFVSLYAYLFGVENSIAGVAVLLSVMAFRHVDLGFDIRHSAAVLLGIFGILAAGPHAANLVPPVPAFFINLICILMLTFAGCHNPLMSNHSILVLSYLLLYGYDVSGPVYIMRVLSLAAGGAAVSFIMYRNHKKTHYKRSFGDLFREFKFASTRGRWQIQMALGIASALLLGQLLGFPRIMWIGFAVMSVMQPFVADMKTRSFQRMGATLVGCSFFFLLYLMLPGWGFALIGMAGGVCVGYCATYFWQSVFNVFGALATAIGLFGVGGAIAFRIIDNLFGILYAVAFSFLFHAAVSWISEKHQARVQTAEVNGDQDTGKPL